MKRNLNCCLSAPSLSARLTLLAPLLLCSVDVIFELDADLPLVRLVPDEGVFQQLLSGRTLSVILHQGTFNEAEELLGPIQVNGMFGLEHYITY